MSNIIQLGEEYVYTTIPKDYVYVYYSILTMLAELGEDMLKDCKATCKDRNSGIIECKNMFDAAIAARALGNIKLADTIIKYIKAKINQILGTKNEFVSYNFPVNGGDPIKYILDTNNNPIIKIDETNAESYKDNLVDIINNCIASLNNNFKLKIGQRTLIESDDQALMDEDNNLYIAKGYTDTLTVNIQTEIRDADCRILKDDVVVSDTSNAFFAIPDEISEDCKISTEVIFTNGIKFRQDFNLEFIYASYVGVAEGHLDVDTTYPIVKHDSYVYENMITTLPTSSGFIWVIIPSFYKVNSIFIKDENGNTEDYDKTLVTLHDIEYCAYYFLFTPGNTYSLYINT